MFAQNYDLFDMRNCVAEFTYYSATLSIINEVYVCVIT